MKYQCFSREISPLLFVFFNFLFFFYARQRAILPEQSIILKSVLISRVVNKMYWHMQNSKYECLIKYAIDIDAR